MINVRRFSARWYDHSRPKYRSFTRPGQFPPNWPVLMSGAGWYSQHPGDRRGVQCRRCRRCGRDARSALVAPLPSLLPAGADPGVCPGAAPRTERQHCQHGEWEADGLLSLSACQLAAWVLPPARNIITLFRSTRQIPKIEGERERERRSRTWSTSITKTYISEPGKVGALQGRLHLCWWRLICWQQRGRRGRRGRRQRRWQVWRIFWRPGEIKSVQCE